MPAANRARYDAPDAAGRFGAWGGRFVAETLIHALDELTRLYAKASADAARACHRRRRPTTWTDGPIEVALQDATSWYGKCRSGRGSAF